MAEAIVRLACVRHAASVRSEPGSNSQVRPTSFASSREDNSQEAFERGRPKTTTPPGDPKATRGTKFKPRQTHPSTRRGSDEGYWFILVDVLANDPIPGMTDLTVDHAGVVFFKETDPISDPSP